MREAFRRAWGEQFVARGGREVLSVARVEDVSEDFDTVESLLASLDAQLTPARLSTDAPTIQDGLRLACAETRAAFQTAATSPIGENGKPRMLRLTAWIAHAGPANGNGDGFLADDLKEAVQNGLFAAPYVGMVDYNHDFTSYGCWFGAQYGFDQVAGQYGILAEGVIFAWRYTDLADKMLAQQQREGHIDVSMACMPRGIVLQPDPDGGPGTSILLRPVFFTTSVLDVEPADENGRAIGTEQADEPAAVRERALNNTQTLATTAALLPDLTAEPLEAPMTIAELLQAFREHTDEAQRVTFAPMVEAFERLPQVEAELETERGLHAAAVVRVTEREADVARLEAERDELASQVEAQDAELAPLRAAAADAEAARVLAEAQAARDARVAELNGHARQTFDARPEAERLELATLWIAMPEIAWAMVRDAMNVPAAATNPYALATEREGGLPVTGAPSQNSGRLSIDRLA